MLVKSLVLSVAAAAVAVDASKILVPLYSYSENCWPELQTAAAANPSASFIAIINPNSGPILDTSDPSLYCVPVLRQKIPNLTVVGYVRTDYGNRAPKDVLADIATYKKWAGLKVSEGGVSGSPTVDGIFFDETPTFSDTTVGFDKYVLYSRTARQRLGSKSTIIFNPGTGANTRLYSYADLVVTYEDYYKNFAAAKLPRTAKLQQKSAIMIHTIPSDTTTLQAVLKSVVPRYGAVYITDANLDEVDVYQVWGSNWSAFVQNFVAFNKSAASKLRRAITLE
ncbi:hypothetical protein JCM6882_008450 [Rhodosporidiobolus microsporus]